MWVSSRITVGRPSPRRQPAQTAHGTRKPNLEGFGPPAAVDPAVFETTNTSTGWPGAKWETLQNDFAMLADCSLSPLCLHALIIEDWSRDVDATRRTRTRRSGDLQPTSFPWCGRESGPASRQGGSANHLPPSCVPEQPVERTPWVRWRISRSVASRRCWCKCSGVQRFTRSVSTSNCAGEVGRLPSALSRGNPLARDPPRG